MNETITAETLDLTAAQLADYANRDADDFASNCLDEAIALVARHARGVQVPAVIARRAVLEVGANLLKRAGRDGIAGYDDGQLDPLRVTRDPLQAARDILAPYTTRAVF